MKILTFVFILYAHYCTSQFVGTLKKAVTSFPKKVRPGIIQYNYAGKYSKPLDPTIKTKKQSNKRDYTVFAKPFPKSDETRVLHQVVPDSPYFPVDEPRLPERRTRVKKVLPEYPLPVRQKRSADGEDNPIAPSALSSDKTISRPKISETPKSLAADNGAKNLKAPVKRNVGPMDKLKSAKRVHVNRSGKKQGAVKESRSKVGSRNQKLIGSRNQKVRVPQNGRISHKLSRPGLGRSKKLKASQKKLSKSDLSERKLKAGRPQRGLPRQKSKNVKRRPQAQPSKVRGARYSKGRSARRLTAARDALIEDYPYTISIQKDGAHWCSGAILNPRLIITTANCLWRSSSISRLRVRAGSRHTDRGGQVARIQEVMKHPGWKIRMNPDNDVALALLDRNIRFSHGVHGVDLPNRVMLPPFDDAWITSWGAERRDGIFDSRSVNLQAYHARLMNRAKCNNITKRFAVTVSDNFICLAQTGYRAPCTRDTGAPAVSDGVLWGLASWGIRKLCGTERFPAMFSYLASQSNINFIVNATHYLMAEERTYPFLDRYPLKKVSLTTPTVLTMPHFKR